MAAEQLRLGLLGPLEVLVDGQPVAVPPGRLQVLVAMLALAAGRPVSVDRLGLALWDESPPQNMRRTLHTYLTRLRQLLGADAIQTSAAGYALLVTDEQVDARQFLRVLDLAVDPASERDMLDRALALWRGSPFAGTESRWLAANEAPRLVERHLAAVERRADLAIEDGQCARVVAQLRELTAHHPLRESLWERLLRALHLAGRQAEALEHYEAIRVRLADELGTDPSEQLRDLHQAILRGSQPAEPSELVPLQLPASPAGFVGRESELAALADRTQVTVVSGPPGIGKSALVVRAAHRLRGQYSDGQLFVDLQGFAGKRALRPADVLPRFLRGLGMPAEQVPIDVDEQAAAFRSRVAGKRVLVVLDNAATADQVRPLLPGEPACAVLVTSRNQLRDLVIIEGARPLQLESLTAAEARAALAAQLGDERMAAEAGAAADLAEACGRLPLALRVAGATLALRPYEQIQQYVVELRGADRFSGQSVMTAAFDASYAALTPSARRLFRLLGLVAGHDFTVAAASALAGDSARRELDELVSASLVQQSAPGRFRMHDLVRDDAAHRARTEPDDQARRRLFGWYLEMIDAALVPRYPASYRLPRAAPGRAAVAESNIGWIDRELPNIMAAIADADANGPVDLCWQLADALRVYFGDVGRLSEWATATGIAGAAAARAGDAQAEAAIHLGRGTLASYLRDESASAQANATAAALFERAGDLTGVSVSWYNRAVLLTRASRHVEALAAARRALASAEEIGDRVRVPMALTVIAHIESELGQLRAAAEALEELLTIPDIVDNSRAVALNNLGDGYRRLGQYDQAVRRLEEARAIFGELDARRHLVDTMHDLARTHCDAGRWAVARTLAEQAAERAEELGVRALIVCSRTAVAETAIRGGDRGPWVAMLTELTSGDVDYPTEQARLLEVLALAHCAAGDYEKAREASVRGVELAGRQSARLDGDAALTMLCAALAGLGRTAEAIRSCEEALRRHRETGYRIREARTLCSLGDAYLGAGDPVAARRHWDEARQVYLDIHSAEAILSDRRVRLDSFKKRVQTYRS